MLLFSSSSTSPFCLIRLGRPGDSFITVSTQQVLNSCIRPRQSVFITCVHICTQINPTLDNMLMGLFMAGLICIKKCPQITIYGKQQCRAYSIACFIASVLTALLDLSLILANEFAAIEICNYSFNYADRIDNEWNGSFIQVTYRLHFNTTRKCLFCGNTCALFERT